MAGDCGEALAVDAEVVIVGAGIAGLATALALRQVGMGGVLVLERHAELRATGAALTIFPNGWMALRALGVAHKLTSRPLRSQWIVREIFLVAGKLMFSIWLL
jgi:2-polyprenyl-6-methoxyphenol hydroxylase-like FAD-dependent oxidoreductase